MRARVLIVIGGAAVAVALWFGLRDRARPAKPAPAVSVARHTPVVAASPAEAPGGAAAAVPVRSPATPPGPQAPAGDTSGVASYDVPAGAAPPPLNRPGATSTAPTGSPYPAGLSADEERAMRLRHLVELRELVGDADARLAAGDDDGGKLAAFRDESAGRLAELEDWADDHRVTAGELDEAAAQVETARATAVVEPPRP